jgi:ethanolamine utilization protein EutM
MKGRMVMADEKKTSEKKVPVGTVTDHGPGSLQVKEQMRGQGKSTSLMAVRKEALGFFETRSFTALVYGMDAMLKAADVSFVRFEKLGDALVGVCILGDISSVQVAIEVGKQSLKEEEYVRGVVIPNPHASLMSIVESKQGIRGEIGI